MSLSADLLRGAAAAAAYIGVDRRVVYRMTASGHLPAIRKGRVIFYRKSDLEKAFPHAALEGVEAGAPELEIWHDSHRVFARGLATDGVTIPVAFCESEGWAALFAEALNAQAMSASGQDPKGLEAKPASAVGNADAPNHSPVSAETPSNTGQAADCPDGEGER